jgi:hypothetical protein
MTSQPDKYVVIMFDQMGRGYSDPSRNSHYTEREYLPAMFNLLTYLKRLKSLTLLAPSGLLNLYR